MRYRIVRTIPQKWHHYSVKTRRKEISDENIHHSKKPTKNSSYQHLQAILAVILVIVLCDYASTSTVIGVGGFVIAPPWANPQLNPCSATSWQLIHWPGDGVCYPIFSQGPCPRTQELGFNEATGRAECRCPKDLLYWPAADRCYEQFTRGPCQLNQYLVRKPDEAATVDMAQCKNTEICANGWIFWPSMQQCYQLYTQGPCHKGDLLIMNALTAEPYCGCDPLLLRQYYFSPLGLCYEHNTRGPCETGLLFAYNHTAQVTHCMCSPELDNYHPETQQCFQFTTKGPCKKGQIYEVDALSGYGECRCRSGYVNWPPNGECYKSFTPGPCNIGASDSHRLAAAAENFASFIVPTQADPKLGTCAVNPCPRAHLFFPENEIGDGKNSTEIATELVTVRKRRGFIHGGVHRSGLAHGGEPLPGWEEPISGDCYKVGSRGPCPLGELVVFERYSGKSFRGECGCSEGYNQNYWPQTDQCYEWYSQGPCNDSFLFAYNREEGRTECICDEQEGFVYWNETGKCYRVYTKGPCPENAWLIPADDLSEVFCECRTGFTFSPDTYTCEPDTEATEDEEYLLDPSALGGLSMLPFLKTYKQLLMQTGGEGAPSGGLSGSEGNRKMDLGADDEDQSGLIHRRPAVQWTRGIFVNPRSSGTKKVGGVGGRRRPKNANRRRKKPVTPKTSVELKEEDVFDLPRASPLRAPAPELDETTSRTTQQRSSRKGRANSVLMQSRSNAQLDWLRRYQARRLQQQAKQDKKLQKQR